MMIRVTTLAGDRDIEILDWDRAEVLFGSVPVSHLSVPSGEACPATVTSDYSEDLDYLKMRLGESLGRMQYLDNDQNVWLKRHADWFYRHNVGGG